MISLNKAIIIGTLEQNPEQKVTRGGSSLTRLTVVTKRVSRGQGENREYTEYHHVVAFGKFAEAAGFLKRGDLVYVEGILTNNSWEDQTGVKRQRTEIIAQAVRPLLSDEKTIDVDRELE